MTVINDPISAAYDWEEIQAILNIAKEENYRDFVLLSTLAYTGRRVVEIVGRNKPRKSEITRDNKKYICINYVHNGLKPEHIDFYKGIARFEIAKQFDKERKHRIKYVKLNNYINQLLFEYIRKAGIRHNDRIFPITPERVGQIVKKYVEKAGIVNKKRLTHAFRHGFALHFLEVGSNDPYSLVNLKEAMCHSSMDVTTEYLKYRKSKNETIDFL